MKNLTRTKELLPAPENGSPSVNYYITSTHTEIDATESGAATVPGLEIALTQWKRVGQNPSVVSSDLYFGFVRIKDGVASPWGTPAKTTRLTLQGRDADTYNCIEARLWDDDWHVVSQFPINVKWKAKDGDNGDDAVTYEIRLSPSVVTRHNDNTFTPSSVVLSSYRKVGDGSPAAFSGYMTIQTATGYVVHSGTHSQYGLTPSASWDWPLKVKMWASIADANAEATPLAEESIHMVSDGEAGDTQLMYYPAGEYSSIKTYTRTDRLCPVVLYNNYYYYLKVATNRVEGIAHDPKDSDYWGLATQFIFAIFQAVFAAFANLGSFIVSGDFFISQYGTLYHGSTETVIDAGNYMATWNGKVPYTYFDASDPWVDTLPASDSYKFRPTLVLNAKTGGTYQNNSWVRGVLRTKAIYTVTGDIVTVNGKQTIDLDNNPGNSYVLPASTIVYLPDPANYEGLTITILFSDNSVLASTIDILMAYYSGNSNYIANSMSLNYIHATDALSVLTLRAIKAYGGSNRVNWVVVEQRGILYLRNSADGADAYQILPDGRLIT